MLTINNIFDSGYEDVQEIFDNVFLINNFLNKKDFIELKNAVTLLSENDWSANNDKFDSQWENKFYIFQDNDIINKIREQSLQILLKTHENLTINGYSQIIRQFAGSFMVPHVDQHHFTKNNKLIESKYSLVFYLNDNYQGGELNFKLKNFKVKPKENSLLIFPGSKEEYAHGIDTVISGNRYSLPGFAYKDWPKE